MPPNKARSSRPRLQSIGRRVTTIETKRGCNAVQRIVGRELQRIRDRILLRDEYTCRKCGRVAWPRELEIDHVVPLHKGGMESDANRQTLCAYPCHKDKSDREEKERDAKY